jgi:acyl-coenzyme A synthetase/AMP-(fatty) acid ligase
VRADREGFLYFVARADAQLKVAGHRVAPDEIEVVLHAVPEVEVGIVVGVDDPVSADTRLVACVVARAGVDDVAARVTAACKRELPAYMVPAEVRVLEVMPKNQHGKPDRVALRRLVAGAEAT